MEEYISIAEAARRLGDVSEKTIRRAIHAGKLHARYPQPNRAEVLLSDLEAWNSARVIRPGETEAKLKDLERQINALSDQWHKTREAIENIDLLQENLKFEVITQLNKFVTILREQDERIATLESQVTALQSKKAPRQTTLPDGFVWLSDFADLHCVPRNEAQRLYDIHAIHGQKIGPARRNYPAIAAKGRHDFWVQMHTRPDFRSCDDCPHE
jgi:polyhydroxyalkanoate synthesis regulator phasin